MRHHVIRIYNTHGRRFLRYASVSVVGVLFGQTLLYTFHAILDWGAGISNVVAVTLATVPAYLLNRAWVWGKSGPHHLTREVIPFWGMAFIGLVISTFAAAWAADNFDAKIWVNVANLAAFAVLWVVKYRILDRYMFTTPDEPTPVDAVTSTP